MQIPLLVVLLALAGGSALGAEAAGPLPDEKTGGGCWVHFFAAQDFAQPMDRLSGALYVNSVAPPGFLGRYSEKEYLRRARSVVVGPEARLLAYAQPGFESEIFFFGPGHRVRDLHELEFATRVASLKIQCQMR